VNHLSADSYDSSRPRGGTELTWTRVFFPYGKLAHFKECGAACPVLRRDYVDLSLLPGTGSQQEYDEAEALPLCRHCFRTRELYANHPRTRAWGSPTEWR
jgi:hypothetical protein